AAGRDLAQGGCAACSAQAELWLSPRDTGLNGVRHEGSESLGSRPTPSLPDYVLIGHVARDRFGERERVGGSVVYAGVAAARLGRRVGIVTAYAPDLVLPPELASACIARLAAEHTCTF